jgi:sec-independent protein translocase protein TatB
MFDIGFAELLLVSIVGLLVLGPERLPVAIRTISLWLGKFRRSFNSIRSEIERELNTDEIKREIHNDAVMQSLKAAEQDLKSAGQDIQNALPETPYDISDLSDPKSEPKSELELKTEPDQDEKPGG